MASRLAVALIALSLAAPATGTAQTPSIDWSVADRLDGPASIDETAPVRSLPLHVDVDGACPSDATFTLDERPIAASPAGRCAFDLASITPGDHQLRMSAGTDRAAAAVDLRDHLVVSIGDSVASGEGNPEGAGPPWLEKRCHRSLRSGAALAARAVELGDRHSTVSLVPLACSGATVSEGLLGPYDGIDKDPAKGALAPQVDVLLALERPVEALLVSVGANDVHFGALVQFCVFADDCPNAHFNPSHPRAEASATAPTAAEVERAAIAKLPGSYDALAARLDGQIDPARVIIVEYFDPLRDAHGETCQHALPHVSSGEAQWAQRNVLAPLNDAVRAAAARHGWQVVGGVAQAYRRHGICAGNQAWIRRPAESALGQLALSGTLHPNGPGHVATGALIASKLAATLALSPGVEQIIGSSHEGYVRWWWLLVAATAGILVAVAGTVIVILLTRRRAARA